MRAESVRPGTLGTARHTALACGWPSECSSRRLNPERAATPRTLDQIGYAAEHLEAIRRAIRAPDGLVLIVGPTRSGRRTALYSMLEELDASRRAVHTIESSLLRPVSCWRQSRVPIRRCRCDARGWQRALARALRSAAATILIEKIEAVAPPAIQAAQAGHLVLSTMAVGRACSAIAELRRLHVTTTQIIDALSLVIGHRLIAGLCADCSMPDDREPVRQALAAALNTWLHGHVARPRRASPAGCAHCGQTGHAGPVLVYELLDIDARARGLIASSHDPVELEHGLLAEGSSIWDCGLRRVADGVASFDALLAGVRQPH
jgi:general secretion pathway protein E